MRPLVLTFCCWSLACTAQDASSEAARVQERPPELLLRDDARAITYSPADHGRQVLTYDINIAYPAERVICEMTALLKTRGWKPLLEDILNPGTGTSYTRGWMDYADAKTQPRKQVRMCAAEWWLPSTGEIVAYFLTYSYPEHATPDLQHLHVAAMKQPGELVRRILPPARIEGLPSLAAPPDLAPRLTREPSGGFANCAAQ